VSYRAWRFPRCRRIIPQRIRWKRQEPMIARTFLANKDTSAVRANENRTRCGGWGFYQAAQRAFALCRPPDLSPCVPTANDLNRSLARDPGRWMARISKAFNSNSLIIRSGGTYGPVPLRVLQGSIPEFFRQDPHERTQHGFSGPPEVQHHHKTQRSVHGGTYDSIIVGEARGGAAKKRQVLDGKGKRNFSECCDRG